MISNGLHQLYILVITAIRNKLSTTIMLHNVSDEMLKVAAINLCRKLFANEKIICIKNIYTNLWVFIVHTSFMACI